jgi:hypothetical protein
MFNSFIYARHGIHVTNMAESDGSDDQADNEPNEGPACAQPEPATCQGRMGFVMKAINHLFISQPPKTDLRDRADTLSAWLKSSVPTLHTVNGTRFIGWWQDHVVDNAKEWVDYDDLEEDGNDEDNFVVGDEEEFEDEDDGDEEEQKEAFVTEDEDQRAGEDMRQLEESDELAQQDRGNCKDVEEARELDEQC